MAIVAEKTGTTLIGATAGIIWKYLKESGPVTLTKLAKEIDGSRDVIMQAVGWLAREEKIVIREDARSKVIDLA